MVRAAAQRGIRLSPAKDGFDEAFEPSGAVRPHYRPLVSTLRASTPADLERRERLQKLSLMSLGITFTVYGAEEGMVYQEMPERRVERAITPLEEAAAQQQ